MLKLSVCLLLTFPLCLLNRIICSECDTDLLSGRGEPQHHTGLDVLNQNSQFPQLTFYLLWTVSWSQTLSPVSSPWRCWGPRVSGSTVYRTSPVWRRRPQRRTTQTSCVQTQDRWLGSVTLGYVASMSLVSWFSRTFLTGSIQQIFWINKNLRRKVSWTSTIYNPYTSFL